MSFEGKTVWITGASSGIGEALAHVFGRRGARLVLSSRNEQRLQAVKSACPNPDQHLVAPLDLSAPETLKDAADRVLAQLGKVDVLVNNGGISQRSLAKETPLEVDRRIMEVNFFGTVALTKCLLPSMIERRAGHIVVISSLVGKFGTPLRSTYAASKHALHGFMESLRAETWREGVRVSLVCPGFIKTHVSVNALTADGSPQGTMDNAQLHGMLPEACAEKIVSALERGRDEIIVGRRETLAVTLKRFMPGLLDAVIRRARVT